MVLLVLDEKGMVASDVLFDGPDRSVGSRLGGAAAEKLDAVEPHAEDSVELSSFALGGPFHHDLRKLRRRTVSAADRRKAVLRRHGRLSVRGAERVAESEERAFPLRRRRGFNGLRDLEVARRFQMLWRRVVVGYELWSEVSRRFDGRGLGEREKEKEEREWERISHLF